MKRSSRPRRTVELSQSLQQHINVYALAAGVAGVGMSALALPAGARIVYTPANTEVGGKLPIDLNHDGINDFIVHSTDLCSFSGCVSTLDVGAASGENGIAYRFNQYPLALALQEGSRIDSKRKFTGSAIMHHLRRYRSRTSHRGYWFQTTDRYLGLKFQVKGKMHYGWARFRVKSGREAVLTGYAYETIPGKAIVAGATKGPDDAEPTAALNPLMPEPATLGMLAVGAPGLSIWRRKQSEGAALESN
jgi:hypothetical protein